MSNSLWLRWVWGSPELVNFMNLLLFRMCLERVWCQIKSKYAKMLLRNSHSEPIFLCSAERLYQNPEVEALQGTSHDEGYVDILDDDAMVWLVNALAVNFLVGPTCFPFERVQASIVKSLWQNQVGWKKGRLVNGEIWLRMLYCQCPT